MVDQADRTLPTQLMSQNDDLTPAVCLQACHENGFAFAGVQAGHECFCSNDEPGNDKLAPESDCQWDCRGDSSLKCGGAWRLSVYKYGNQGKNFQCY